ncbi:SMI1/KNR4 family protein [Massilia sp. B-10]|nr:SMI1/KNR4 family protein [Massilia sp. B-10]
MRTAFNLAEQFVLAAEEALGAILPATYRIAMMAENGGELTVADEDWALIPIRDAADRKRLARSSNDIVTETKSHHDWRGFPEDVVVIAENGGGDSIVFRREDAVFNPAPHVWDHETGTLHKHCDDFSEPERLR